MLWSHGEANLLKEFLHVSRAGGRFEGPVEEASWELITQKMNQEGLARGIALRTYTARDVAWYYLSQIFPLFQPDNRTKYYTGGHWSADEDDLLLYYLSSTYQGGLFDGPIQEGTLETTAENMNKVARMFGFNARLYTSRSVEAHYYTSIRPHIIEQYWSDKWYPGERGLLRRYAHVSQGGSAKGEIPSIPRLAMIMKEEARRQRMTDLNYSEILTEKRLKMLKEEEEDAPLPEAYLIPANESDEENDDMQDYEMGTTYG